MEEDLRVFPAVILEKAKKNTTDWVEELKVTTDILKIVDNNKIKNQSNVTINFNPESDVFRFDYGTEEIRFTIYEFLNEQQGKTTTYHLKSWSPQDQKKIVTLHNGCTKKENVLPIKDLLSELEIRFEND